MPETVALIKKKQKSFSKSVEKTKDKIKKGDIIIAAKTPKRLGKPRGVIYVSNIPHGFYEKEITGYFSQFGDVYKARVARSKKTGNSKGHAFIQFKDLQVAKIAAETMNNYLMGKRLLKAKLLPDDKKTRSLFKKPNFSKEHCPTKVRRSRFKKSFNAAITDNKLIRTTKKALKQINNVTNKLKEAGIDYNFSPVNVPKQLEEAIKAEGNMDDSSSEDIVFTPPENMVNKNWKEETSTKTALIKKRTIGKNKTNDSPKKVKKEKKQKKNEINLENMKISLSKINKNVQIKEKKIEQKLAIKENNANKNSEVKKQKKENKSSTFTVTETTPTKKSKNNVSTKKVHANKLAKNNSENADNNSNENKENIKKSPKNKKQKKVENTQNNVNENNENIKKEKQKKKDLKTKKMNDSINEAEESAKKKKKTKLSVEGIAKKKVQKMSDKKASLIKGLIQANDQVKTVKRIDKKKIKTKVSRS